MATAAQTIGPDRWPRFIGDAERRGVAAVSDGAIPGVVKASIMGSDVVVGAVGVGLVLLTLGLMDKSAGPARSTVTPSTPTSVPPAKPKDDTVVSPAKGEPPAATGPELTPGPGSVVISDDRRKHILDGDATGGGHRPGQNVPGKSEFPPGWSDDRIVDAIKDVANDPGSLRQVDPDGSIAVTSTRDGVNIRVIIKPDKKTVVTAYPTICLETRRENDNGTF